MGFRYNFLKNSGKEAARPGEGKNSWLTGTAAWNWYLASQWILGIKPEYDGLSIEPCCPSVLKSFKVHRQWRDAVYNIEVILTGKGGKAFLPYESGEHNVTLEL